MWVLSLLTKVIRLSCSVSAPPDLVTAIKLCYIKIHYLCIYICIIMSMAMLNSNNQIASDYNRRFIRSYSVAVLAQYAGKAND